MAKKVERPGRADKRLRASYEDGARRKKSSDVGVLARGIGARFRSKDRHFSESVGVVREDRDAV